MQMMLRPGYPESREGTNNDEREQVWAMKQTIIWTFDFPALLQDIREVIEKQIDEEMMIQK